MGIHVEIESKDSWPEASPLVSCEETLSLAVITERLQNRRREVRERHEKKATLGLKGLESGLEASAAST